MPLLYEDVWQLQAEPVTIRIEASSEIDTYTRYHGKAVDQALDPRFWDTQPEKTITVSTRIFSHEQTISLPFGSHYVIYGNSGSVPDYAWRGRIYINGELVAEGDVGRNMQLRADFTVGVPPTWWQKAKEWWARRSTPEKAVVVVMPIAAIAGAAAGIITGPYPPE